MADVPELLPCPFCGGALVKSIAYAGKQQHPEDPTWWAGCTKCDAGIDAVGEQSAIAAWNTRAAPPAMDRGAVERDELAKRLFWADVLLGDNPERLQPEWRDRWWDEMSTMPLSGPGFLRKWRALADAALSTLSADAIRQGEGDIERAAKVADYYAEEAETHADMTDLGARVEMNWHVRAEALRAVAKRIRALATPASHASDGGKA